MNPLIGIIVIALIIILILIYIRTYNTSHKPNHIYLSDDNGCTDCVGIVKDYPQILQHVYYPVEYNNCYDNSKYHDGYCNDLNSDDAVSNCKTLCNNNSSPQNFWQTTQMFNIPNQEIDPNLLCVAYGFCDTPQVECVNSCAITPSGEIGQSFCSRNLTQGMDLTGECMFNCIIPTLIQYNLAAAANQTLYDKNKLSPYWTSGGNDFYNSLLVTLCNIENTLLGITSMQCDDIVSGFNVFTTIFSTIKDSINLTIPITTCLCCDISDQQNFMFGLCSVLDPSFNISQCNESMVSVSQELNTFISDLRAIKQNPPINWKSVLCVFVNEFVFGVLQTLISIVKPCGAISLPLKLGEIMAVLKDFSTLIQTIQTNFMLYSFLIILCGAFYNGCTSDGSALTYDAGTTLGLLFLFLINDPLAPDLSFSGNNTLQIGTGLYNGQYLVQGNYNLIMDYDGYLKFRQNFNVGWQIGSGGGYICMLSDGGYIGESGPHTGIFVIDNGLHILDSVENCSQFCGVYLLQINNGDLQLLSNNDDTFLWSANTGCQGSDHPYQSTICSGYSSNQVSSGSNIINSPNNQYSLSIVSVSSDDDDDDHAQLVVLNDSGNISQSLLDFGGHCAPVTISFDNDNGLMLSGICRECGYPCFPCCDPYNQTMSVNGTQGATSLSMNEDGNVYAYKNGVQIWSS